MMKTYVFDANTVSYLLRNGGDVPKNFKKFIIDGDASYAIPQIVAYEVKGWLNDRPTKQKLLFAQEFDVLFEAIRKEAEMDDNVWDKAVEIYIVLKHKGQLIGGADILIAAYSTANDFTLVTRNKSDFARIADLRLVDWFV